MVRSQHDPPHRDPQHARNGKRRDEPLCGGHAQQRRRHGPRRMIAAGFVETIPYAEQVDLAEMLSTAFEVNPAYVHELRTAISRR